MRILVTGGAGFIGSHLVDAYLNAGHEVAFLDNLSTGKPENCNKNATFFQGDIIDAPYIEKIFKEFNPEIINHHAAQISVVRSVENPLEDARLNIIGTLTVLEAIKKLKEFKKMIYVSSGGTMYGDQEIVPTPEDAEARPVAPYAQSKYGGEQYVWLYKRLSNLQATVLRYGNVFGPRQDPHGEAGVCAIFTGKMLAGEPAKIFGDGTQQRDYVYISDVVQANLLALEKGNGEAINIGTGTPTSTEKVFRTIASATNYTQEPVWSPARPGEMQRSFLDIQKAKKILGWQPQVTFKEGIEKTVAWYPKS